MRRFVDGLLFGAGFGLSFLLLSYLAAYALYPLLPYRSISSELPSHTAHSSGTLIAESRSPNLKANSTGLEYHDLPFEEQINQAIAIVVTKYELRADGLRKAIVSEYLKGAPTKDFSYKIGDEMTGQSFYAKMEESRGDGSVVFYVDRPEMSQMSVTYEGDRLGSFGGMPLDVLRKLCKKSPDA